MRLYDPLEMDLPDLGLLAMQDAETGEQLFVDTHDRGFRKRFAAAAERREAGAARGASRGPASTRSSSPPTTTWSTRILRFADLRKRRSRLHWRRGGMRPTCGRPPDRLERVRMTFLWPELLWLLLRCCRCWSLLYVWLLHRRKKKHAVRYASLAMVQARRWARAAHGAATCRRRCSCSRSPRMLFAAGAAGGD